MEGSPYNGESISRLKRAVRLRSKSPDDMNLRRRKKRKALVEIHKQKGTSFGYVKQDASTQTTLGMKELQVRRPPSRPTLMACAPAAPAISRPPRPQRQPAARAPHPLPLADFLSDSSFTPASSPDEEDEEEEDEGLLHDLRMLNMKRMRYTQQRNPRDFFFRARQNDNKENKMQFTNRNRNEAVKRHLPSLHVTSYQCFEDEQNQKDTQCILTKQESITIPKIKTMTNVLSKDRLEKGIRKRASSGIILPKVPLVISSTFQECHIQHPALLATLPKISIAKQGRIREPGSVPMKGVTGEGSSRVIEHREKTRYKSTFAPKRPTRLPGIRTVESVGRENSYWYTGVPKANLPKTSTVPERPIRLRGCFHGEEARANRPQPQLTYRDIPFLKIPLPKSIQDDSIRQPDVLPGDGVGEQNSYSNIDVPQAKHRKTSAAKEELIDQSDTDSAEGFGTTSDEGHPAFPPLTREKPLDLKQVLAWKARRRAKAEALCPRPYTKSISKYVVPPLCLDGL